MNLASGQWRINNMCIINNFQLKVEIKKKKKIVENLVL